MTPPTTPPPTTPPPTTRRALVTAYGGPDVIRLDTAKTPDPGPGEVCVRTETSGIAFADLLMREGLYPGGLKPPYVPGYDLVGRIDAVGEGVTTPSVGDRVAALSVWGANAERVVLSAENLVPVPEGLDAAEAVSLVLNYTTAYQMLHRVAKVQPGERILVHGGAGGVGTALLQLGKLAGLELYATASKAKHPLVEQLGATPIDYERGDFVSFIRYHTGDGVDAVFDAIGGYHALRSQQTLRDGGRLVSYGVTAALANGRRQPWFRRVGTYLGLGLALASKFLRKRDAALYVITDVRKAHPDWFRDDLTTLFGLLADGRVAPVIAERLPLEDVARAHTLLADSAVRGKLVVQMDASP